MLQSLTLTHYRNYDSASLRFGKGIHQITGANGSGKSNLLEAIHFISFGRSFRHLPYEELIQHGKEGFSLSFFLQSDQIDHTLVFSTRHSKKQILHDNKHYPSFTPLLGLYPSVLISPTDIELIYGSPQERRRFLNMHIAQIDPLYAYHCSRYKKACEQRNWLLREQKKEMLPIWDHQMALSAIYIGKTRKQFLEQLKPHINSITAFLSNQQEIYDLHIESSLKTAIPWDHPGILEKVIELYHLSHAKDLLFKTTSYGPHRDDLIFQYNGHSVRSIASEGQKRVLIIALKLGVGKLMQEKSHKPFICIDDAPAHLDPTRQQRLLELTADYPQVFLTLPTPLDSSLPFHEIDVTSLQHSPQAF